MTHARRLGCLTILLLVLTLASPVIHGGAATPAPPLPPPSGTVVDVSTEAQLQTAIAQLASNTTIVLAPGTYRLTNTLYISGAYTNVGLRGATDNRDDVVLQGAGMTNAAYGNVPYGIWTGGNVQGITIANLTIRDVFYHPIIFNAGTQSPRVYNVHLVDAGEQFIKSNPDGAGGGVDNGIVEYSIIEYTTTAKDYYTNGVDVQTGAAWIIRHNVFRNIVAPAGQLAGPAVLVWNGSRNTVTEGNTFLNCARGIAYGLVDVAGGFDHSGGIIRNNFLYRSSSQPGDVAIGLADSPNTQVLNNTVFLSSTYGTPIEYRFAGTTGVVLTNNLLDGIIFVRDGATGTELDNLTGAGASMFVNAAAGDLHLAASAIAAIDRGVTVANVSDDWDGQLRPQGAGYDIGADEFGSVAPTYQIGGRVSDATGAALSGVTMTLSGTRSQTATADSAGVYAFNGLPSGGDYTVTPSKTGYVFMPGSLTFAVLGANQPAANFTGSIVNQPPSVALTAPTNGSTFTAPAAIMIAATASSSTSFVTSVAFYAGSTPIGSASAAPYTVAWSNVAAGTYSLTAVATDSLGASTRSAAVTVTVANPLPPGLAIDVVSPKNQSIAQLKVTTKAFSTTAGNELLLAFVSADDPAGTGISVNSVTSGAGLTWKLVKRTNVQLGTAEIWRAFAPARLTNVTVTGTLSQAATSSLTVVSLIGADTSGTFGSGAIGATGSGNANPGTPTATLTTTRNSSWVFGVGNDYDNPVPRTLASNQIMINQYMPPVGDTYWVQRTAAPTPVAGTSVTINDVAPTGDRFNMSICEILPASAPADTTPPTVSLTAPASGSTLSGTAVTVSSAAADNVAVAGVQFKLDGVNLGAELTTSPYTRVWNTTTVADGSHTLAVVARDAAGNQSMSATVSITVSNAPAPPPTPTVTTVSLTAPTNGRTFQLPATIAVSATATATNGSVTSVAFYTGTTAVGTVASAPYTVNWSPASAGTYSLTAVATDTTGAKTTSTAVTVTVTSSGTPSTQPLLQQSSLSYLGSFQVPSGTLGSTYGFGAAGTGGLGTYAMAFNQARNSLFLGGHPYEQRVAELAIPSSLAGTPTATALQNLIDPLEGRLSSINPSDPNSKVIGSALVYNNQLFIGAFSYYDGAGTQTKSEFVRPLNLSTTGQVIGPVTIGSNYPGWVDKYAALIPAEWQSAFGGPVMAGGTLGAINSLQSWGPSASVFNPADVATGSPAPAMVVLGYPYGHPLADTTTGNQYLSQADFITGMVFPTGTRTVLFFGKHGMGNYCYGTGGTSGDCYDPDDNSKGIHSYPYRSQVWAYDANDLIAVKNGQKQSYEVMPYAVWQLDASVVDIQGVAYDPATQRLYVSQVYAENTRPLIRVYQVTP